MITPIELQSKTFKSGIGYDKKDVDNFLSELLRGYEVTYKENMELSDKINTLSEGINYYKSIEKTLQKALILAEQTAEETKNAARQKAKAIEEEASANAKLIIADAVNELSHIKQQTIQLIRQYDSYKAQFKHLAAAQCELLNSDSFNIHIADLEVFTTKPFPEFSKEEDQSYGHASQEKVNSSLAKENIKSDNPEAIEEDFEFYSVED
jgi:cell division initiation protein